MSKRLVVYACRDHASFMLMTEDIESGAGHRLVPWFRCCPANILVCEWKPTPSEWLEVSRAALAEVDSRPTRLRDLHKRIEDIIAAELGAPDSATYNDVSRKIDDLFTRCDEERS